MSVRIIKYMSAITILIAMSLHVAGITPGIVYFNYVARQVGVMGYKWKEKAILLNFLPQFLIIEMLIWIYWISK